VAVEHPAVGTGVGLVRSGVCPQAPFAAVELEVRVSGSGTVLAGLAAESGDHVAAVYDGDRRRIAIEVRRNGRTHVLRRKKVSLPSRFRMAVTVCENQVSVFTDTGGAAGWQPVLTERDRVAALVDLREPALLEQLSYAWGATATKLGSELGAVRAGLFGMTGLRDPHLVQHSDGRPYLRDGKAYLTFTCAGPGFFRQGHWGVFTLDLEDPTRVEQTAQIFARRDGFVLGDHAGQIVRDDDNDRWFVANSSWGDFNHDGVHVRHTTTDVDILHGVHLLETRPTELPTTMSAWDPALTRIENRWHVAFAESPSQKPFAMHPAMARGPVGGDWGSGLERVGAAEEMRQCEGPILTAVDGAWWLLASDGERRCFPVFDLDMHQVGRLDAPYPSNIPHPQIVPLPDGGYLMVTFDGTPYAKRRLGYGTHGDVVIMST
jgi:hypothetical protein